MRQNFVSDVPERPLLPSTPPPPCPLRTFSDAWERLATAPCPSATSVRARGATTAAPPNSPPNSPPCRGCETLQSCRRRSGESIERPGHIPKGMVASFALDGRRWGQRGLGALAVESKMNILERKRHHDYRRRHSSRCGKKRGRKERE